MPKAKPHNKKEKTNMIKRYFLCVTIAREYLGLVAVIEQIAAVKKIVGRIQFYYK